jgi:hypothetical protein
MGLAVGSISLDVCMEMTRAIIAVSALFLLTAWLGALVWIAV